MENCICLLCESITLLMHSEFVNHYSSLVLESVAATPVCMLGCSWCGAPYICLCLLVSGRLWDLTPVAECLICQTWQIDRQLFPASHLDKLMITSSEVLKGL